MSPLHVLVSQKKDDTHGYHSFKKTYFMVILLCYSLLHSY